METTKKVRAERQLAFQLALSDKLRTLSDAADIMFTAAEMLGTQLGAGRVGYAEIDASGQTATIVCDWASLHMSTLQGTHRLKDFGKELSRGLHAGQTLRIEDTSVDALTQDVRESDNFRTIDTRA